MGFGFVLSKTHDPRRSAGHVILHRGPRRRQQSHHSIQTPEMQQQYHIEDDPRKGDGRDRG